MEDSINNLLDSYIKYIYSLSEYKIITKKLKDFTKMHNNKAIVDYYSLQVKIIDKSTYSNKLVPYLKENNLNKFIEEKVNDKKIYNLIKLGSLNEDLVKNNIEEEKTRLDIKIMNFKEEISLFEENFTKQIETTDLIKCIIKRESLRYQISQYKCNYYNYARQIKFFLLDSEIPEYRFQYNNNLGVLRVKNTHRTYNKNFIYNLKANNIDAFDYSVKNSELLKSKSKQINRDIVDQFKINNYKEYLYIKILKGLFNKKNKRAIY